MQHFLENNPLWDFCLDLYSQASVAEKLLQLQDEYGLSINILLAMHWLDLQGNKLTSDQAHQLLEAVNPIDQSVLKPIRSARASFKSIPTPNRGLYEKIKALELDLEHFMIDQLFNYLSACTFIVSNENFSNHNIDIYLNIALNKPLNDIDLKEFYRG